MMIIIGLFRRIVEDGLCAKKSTRRVGSFNKLCRYLDSVVTLSVVRGIRNTRPEPAAAETVTSSGVVSGPYEKGDPQSTAVSGAIFMSLLNKCFPLPVLHIEFTLPPLSLSSELDLEASFNIQDESEVRGGGDATATPKECTSASGQESFMTTLPYPSRMKTYDALDKSSAKDGNGSQGLARGGSGSSSGNGSGVCVARTLAMQDEGMLDTSGNTPIGSVNKEVKSQGDGDCVDYGGSGSGVGVDMGLVDDSIAVGEAFLFDDDESEDDTSDSEG
jgi:hypothetical protein